MDLAQHAQAIADAYPGLIGAGRPSDIGDASILQIFLSEVEAGLHMEPAAELAGLAPNTVRSWLKRGEADETPFNLFLRAFKRAQASAEGRITRNVIKASELPQFWAAGMTYLERSYPDRWGKRSEDSSSPRVVVQLGVKDSDVTINLSPLPSQQLDQISTGQVMHQGLINGDYVNSPQTPGESPALPDRGAGTAEGPSAGALAVVAACVVPDKSAVPGRVFGKKGAQFVAERKGKIRKKARKNGTQSGGE